MRLKLFIHLKQVSWDVKFSYDNPIPNDDCALDDGFRAWIKDLGIELYYK
ncbi:hypothetical protein IUY40_13935 [Flavobacterium sp. ALJ2]|nr:hypothetical protein [Flavobacterium sp. ALJ2]MBF7092632.1 hypothetical protein [Flavobacterium sp. ALJ2]